MIYRRSGQRPCTEALFLIPVASNAEAAKETLAGLLPLSIICTGGVGMFKSTWSIMLSIIPIQYNRRPAWLFKGWSENG